jgi:hypothetical protein
VVIQNRTRGTSHQMKIDHSLINVSKCQGISDYVFPFFLLHAIPLWRRKIRIDLTQGPALSPFCLQLPRCRTHWFWSICYSKFLKQNASVDSVLWISLSIPWIVPSWVIRATSLAFSSSVHFEERVLCTNGNGLFEQREMEFHRILRSNILY